MSFPESYMINKQLKEQLTNQVLLRVKQPAQYVGDELNIIRKDHRELEGKLCLAFSDTYALGMSHQLIHEPYQLSDRLPWAHVNVKYGRTFLEKEQTRAVIQLDSMADAQ